MSVRLVAAAAASGACLLAASVPAPASASVLSPVCSVLRHASIPLAAGCSVANRGLDAGGQLAHGGVNGAVGGVVSGVASDAASVALIAVSGAAAGAAKFALEETGTLIDATTAPRLLAPWFQRVYWRLAGIAVLLTLPCLFAAAVQSLIRSDLALLVRAAFGYLPAAMLGVAICAQLVSLLLAATDVLCGFISGVAGHAAHAFLTRAGVAIVALSAASRSPFLAFVVALFTVAGAIVLWLELMMREAAVYVVVAMLPLAFAALVWPARRVWALRAVELLAALILAKLAMVTVLTLGGAALTQSPDVAGFLVGLVLLVLGAFAPWAMLRIIPMTELAAGVAGRLRAETPLLQVPDKLASDVSGAAYGWATSRLAGGARMAAEMVMARLLSDSGGGQQRPESSGAPAGALPESSGSAQDPALTAAVDPCGDARPPSTSSGLDEPALELGLDKRHRPGDPPYWEPPYRTDDERQAPASDASEPTASAPPASSEPGAPPASPEPAPEVEAPAEVEPPPEAEPPLPAPDEPDAHD